MKNKKNKNDLLSVDSKLNNLQKGKPVKDKSLKSENLEKKQPNENNTGRPKGIVEGILFDISIATHEFVKQNTRHLTSLRDISDEELYFASRKKRVVEIEVNEKSDHVGLYSQRLRSSPPSDGIGGDPFSKDYARIIHSPSFRRLQGKTQLIPAGENDFFRTRLTHTLEVAEIATRIAQKFNNKYSFFKLNPIDLNIVACASLLHDIGHPPFGHSGEEALNEKMEKFGGFEGNAQTLRIVTNLENRLGRGESIAASTNDPRGLNLTVGTLASIIKYDKISEGPIRKGDKIQVKKGYYPTEEGTVLKLRELLGLTDEKFLYTIECQIMDIADDIAYSAYDLEDTLEAGIVTPLDLMSIDDRILDLITQDVNLQIGKSKFCGGYKTPSISQQKVIFHLTKVFGTLILDGEIGEDSYNFGSPNDRIAFVGRTYAESIQHAKNPLVRRQYIETLIEGNINALTVSFDPSFPFLSRIELNPDKLVTIEAMKAFNFRKVISSRRLQLHHHRTKMIISDIFDALEKDREGRLLSEHQRQLLGLCANDEQKRMRLISDIISSFTDLEAIRFYDQLHSSRNTPFLGYTR